MKRPYNIISMLVALSLFILGAFLLWSLSTQTAKVLEMPYTGGVASNEIFLPVIEGGDNGNDNAVVNDSQEKSILEEATSIPAPASNITTRADNNVSTPSPIDWDEPPSCVNEPWDHTQWSNQLIAQRADTQEQHSLKTLFKHQLQPMSPFLQGETLDSVAELFVIDDRAASPKSRLERDVAALWFNVLYGKLNRATEVSFPNPNLAAIKTVGDLLKEAEEALVNGGSLNVIQSGLRQLLAGQDITRPVCGHMIHMRSGNKLEESIWDAAKIDNQIDEQIQGAGSLRVGLVHMEPSPDYSMIAMESWGYESGGPIFLYDAASAKLTNLIETLGIPNKTPQGHQILSDPWEVLGWGRNSRNLLLGIRGTASIWWVDVQEQTYRTISLGHSEGINASKQYVDMLSDGSGFVYINLRLIDSDPEQGPQLLLYDFASDESTLLWTLPSEKGTLMSYPRVSPDSRSVVYILQTYAEEPSPVRHYTPYLLDIGSQTQRILMEKHIGMLGSIPVWSPDGERIAFTLQQTGAILLPEDNSYRAQSNIVMIDIDDNKLTQLTSIQGIATKPVWSPNGRSLSFVTHDRKVGLVSLNHPEHIWQIADDTNSHLLSMSFTLHLP